MASALVRDVESLHDQLQVALPPRVARRVRALIWCHMGENAASVPDPDKIPDLPPFLRDHPDRPRPLHPSAAECFEHSLELAPDHLQAHEGLLHYYTQESNQAGAEQAARRLLEQFPEHVPTLEALSDLLGYQDRYAEALGARLAGRRLDRKSRGSSNRRSAARIRFRIRRERRADAHAPGAATAPSHGALPRPWSAGEFHRGANAANASA